MPRAKAPAKTPAKSTATKIDTSDLPQCRSCVYWTAEPNQEMGLCRRYPPMFITEEGETSASFAVSADDDWCGEFRRRLQG